jgi:arsenite methyltransferase
MKLGAMLEYLHKEFDWRSVASTEAYDELPLWSAAPGQLLLENLPYQGKEVILDIGCGTGFPLLNMARRFGPRARLYGVDAWEAAMQRAERKCAAWGITNVTLLQQDGGAIQLTDHTIDLITSSLGLLNFEHPAAVLGECRRLLKPDGRLCLSTNMRGTFREFYAAFQEIADEPLRQKIKAQENHRHDKATLQALMTENEFEVVKYVVETSTMTYADGTAFLNDYFIVMGFLPSWKALVPEDQRETVFSKLEATLNTNSRRDGHLRLSVPIAYLELRLR